MADNYSPPMLTLPELPKSLTGEDILNLIDRFTSIAQWVVKFIPGEWDDQLVAIGRRVATDPTYSVQQLIRDLAAMLLSKITPVGPDEPVTPPVVGSKQLTQAQQHMLNQINGNDLSQMIGMAICHAPTPPLVAAAQHPLTRITRDTLKAHAASQGINTASIPVALWLLLMQFPLDAATWLLDAWRQLLPTPPAPPAPATP